MKAERIGEDEGTFAIQAWEERREHCAVKDGEFLSNVLGRHALFESRMKHQVVKRHVPSYTQRVAGQDD